MSFHGVKYLSRRRNQIHHACDRDFKEKHFYEETVNLCTVYLLNVYVCIFDARQHVVFINKLFELKIDKQEEL
jgi:hypothetical protein